MYIQTVLKSSVRVEYGYTFVNGHFNGQQGWFS